MLQKSYFRFRVGLLGVPLFRALLLSNLLEYHHKHILPKTGFFRYVYRIQYRSNFNYFDVIDLKLLNSVK